MLAYELSTLVIPSTVMEADPCEPTLRVQEHAYL